jgi:hypothetical protein
VDGTGTVSANAVVIQGGGLQVNGGSFHLDGAGNVTANSLFVNGPGNITAGGFSVNGSNGMINANDMQLNGTLHLGPGGIASNFGFAVAGNGGISAGPSNFTGNVNVSGNLSKGGGSFKIDHPLDPANKYLYHSFVESPDMKNIYDGVVKLNAKGEAWVTMPDWFEALNMEFRYQLTSIGAPGPNLYIAREIKENRFKISGGKPGAKVSWQVTGTRHDAYADAYRIQVEEEKKGTERGTYLHPELFGNKTAVGQK